MHSLRKFKGKTLITWMKNQREKMKHFEFFFSDIMCENIWADPHFLYIGEKIEETVTNLVTVKKDFNLHYCCHEEFQI